MKGNWVEDDERLAACQLEKFGANHLPTAQHSPSPATVCMRRAGGALHRPAAVAVARAKRLFSPPESEQLVVVGPVAGRDETLNCATRAKEGTYAGAKGMSMRGGYVRSSA